VSYQSILNHIVREDDGTSSGVWGPYQLKTAFQPIFAFREGKLSIAAFEGLIRPFRDNEPVAPGIFFSSLPAIDRLNVETLARTLHLLNAAACLPRQAALFVNFDPSVFLDRSIANTALQDMKLILNRVGIDPHRVVCEVTEQKSPSQEALRTFVQVLRANGFRIAVDDYGAEDSDFERIKALKPEIVKFDAHWITRLMETGPGFALLRTMVSIFADQGITTVFEGIEENWQLDLAERSGAAMVQGFVLARPEIVPTDYSMFRLSPMPLTTRDNGSPSSPSVPSAAPAEPAGRRLFPKSFGRKVGP
jgi:EAL domain-containing protein (putative c-di-GMP-specific phosphodiesterase class I)